jgi:hypothetical protein
LQPLSFQAETISKNHVATRQSGSFYKREKAIIKKLLTVLAGVGAADDRGSPVAGCAEDEGVGSAVADCAACRRKKLKILKFTRAGGKPTTSEFITEFTK